MDMQYHAILLLLDDQRILAPVQNPERILDQGTGTGSYILPIITTILLIKP